MKILFDQGTPAPLRHSLAGHHVATAFEMGWSNLSNGDLLRVAEDQFDLLITTDRNLRYQQNLVGRRMGIVVLPTTSWPKIQVKVSDIVAVVNAIQPGEYREVSF
jgi:hypothetical protein